MAFCNMCGAQIADGAAACPACAARASGAAASPVASATGTNDNVTGMLAYFTFIPALIFLVMEPYNRNRFVRFHAFQSLFFSSGWIILWYALRIVLHIPFFGWITIFLWPLIWLAGFAVWIFLVIKANQGLMYKLPVIGDFAEKQANTM